MRVCIASTFAASVLICAAALAAEQQKTEQANTDSPIVRASGVSGLVVYNPQNERLGKIEDLVLDPKAGKIRYAVLSFGGALGLGEKYFAIPWQSLKFVSKGETREGTQNESYIVLDANKDSLKNAPGFDQKHWPDFADANWQQKVDEYYRTRSAAHGQGETR